MTIYDSNWFLCPRCGPSYHFCFHCGATTCNGLGCDLCAEAREEFGERIAEGRIPEWLTFQEQEAIEAKLNARAVA